MKIIKKTIILCVMFIFMVPKFTLATLVPDTNQNQSYTSIFGEDSDYNINSPSYTKLDVNGNILSDDASSWIMVKDNVTGLIWEIKTTNGSIHDADNKYNWYNAQNNFINQLNTMNFGGFCDWRLPTIKELMSITNKKATTFSLSTTTNFYWSCTNHIIYTTQAWVVNFGGPNFSYHSKSDTYYVRAVRGGQIGTFIDNGNATVTDTATGLMWQKGTVCDRVRWEEAIRYCENLSLDGYDDWRLPNINELLSLVDYNSYMPTIDILFFPDTLSSDFYWSSTTCLEIIEKALVLSFTMGLLRNSSKSNSSGYVRAVRGDEQSINTLAIIPNINVSPTAYDFGNIEILQSSNPLEITITNTGTGVLQISDIAFSNINTSEFIFSMNEGVDPINTIPFIIQQGDIKTFAVTFNPDLEGFKTTEIMIDSYDPDTPTFILALEGTGIVPIESTGEESKGSSSGCFFSIIKSK